MVTGGAVCSNWACTESVRGEVSDGLPYLDGNTHYLHCTRGTVKKGGPALPGMKNCRRSPEAFLRQYSFLWNRLTGGEDFRRFLEHLR